MISGDHTGSPLQLRRLWIKSAIELYRNCFCLSLRAKRSNPEVLKNSYFPGLLRHFVPRKDEANTISIQL